MNLDQQADVGEFWASLEKALVDMGDPPDAIPLYQPVDELTARIVENVTGRHTSRLPYCKRPLEDIAREFASSGLRFTYVPPVKK